MKTQKEMSYLKYQQEFSDKEKSFAAFNKAWEIRNFEINLYWQRATYFWAFIASAFGAYFIALDSDRVQTDFIQLEYVVICIGFIFSLAWTFVNIGSKNWQKNWEGHIDRLEDEFTGPLYKTTRKPIRNFSVSRINIFVSLFITLIWIVLAYGFYNRNHFKLVLSMDNLDIIITISNLMTILFALTMFLIGASGFHLFKIKTKYIIREKK